MTQLFISLYLDEDVDVLLADLIRARGFAVVTTRDMGNLNASDEQQLAYAVHQQTTFLTHNRTDFEELATTYFATNQHHAGIIIAVRHPVHEIARRLSLSLIKSLPTRCRISYAIFKSRSYLGRLISYHRCCPTPRCT